jgi:hypothetical protein
MQFRRTGKPLCYYVGSDFLPNYGTAFNAFLAGACVHHVSRRQGELALKGVFSVGFSASFCWAASRAIRGL